MNEGIKQDNQIAQSIAGFLDKHGTSLFNGVKSVYKKASDQARINWRIGYEKYLDNALNKYFYAKPFLSANRPVPLTEFYVPLGVSSGDRNIEEVTIADLMLTNQFAIITATAGSGKTMMMRHLFVDTINKTSQVPVFVELRELNDTEQSLIQLIKKKLKDNKFDFEDAFVEKAFEAGHFALFLDGFDEVAYVKREKINKEIQELADRFDQNYFILSSRPDDSLYRWTLFDVWRVNPLSLDLACELVEKTPEDGELKEKFIKALQGELFEKHESFLSNPLLLSIMLITYRDSANIPHKLSDFYDRAYVALFDRHDAQKGAYSRDKLSKLGIREFQKVFSAFCFLSYRRNKYGDFSETEISEYLENAKKLSGIDFDGKKYLDDAIQAVCLLVREGLDITFSHRSFQEYFTVLFVSQINNNSIQRRFINESISDDEILDLLLEISPEIIEKQLIIPKLEEIENIIGYQGNIGEDEYLKFLSLLYSSVSVDLFEDMFQVALTVSSVSFTTTQNIIRFNYLSSEKYSWYGDDSEVFKLLNKIGSVSIKKLPQYEHLFRLFYEGDGWLSRSALIDILYVKNMLIEKHTQQNALLEELL